jgi:hypothetical protein
VRLRADRFEPKTTQRPTPDPIAAQINAKVRTTYLGPSSSAANAAPPRAAASSPASQAPIIGADGGAQDDEDDGGHHANGEAGEAAEPEPIEDSPRTHQQDGHQGARNRTAQRPGHQATHGHHRTTSGLERLLNTYVVLEQSLKYPG